MDKESFVAQVESFAHASKELLQNTLVGVTELTSYPLNVENLRASFQLSTPLTIAHSRSDRLNLTCHYRLCTNTTRNHLAVEASSFKIQFRAAKNFVPIVRFEYERDAYNKPPSHIHIHADSVPLGLLLARAGRYEAAAQQHAIHFPMGDARFRVCLEDIVELLVKEFGAESIEGWEDIVGDRRGQFHQAQTETVISHNLETAARLLIGHGYTVEPPAAM